MIIHLSHEDVLDILPDRSAVSHKGDYGKILLLCGSVGYTGAAALAAMGALRTGAGLVYTAVPESIYVIEAIKLTEAIVLPLPDQDGAFCTQSVNGIEKLLVDKDAVLIGPGIGRTEGAQKVTEYVLGNYAGPVILDADGIYAASLHKDLLRGRAAPTVITPHEGEFCRLTGCEISDRVEDAITFSKQYGVITVLKGHNTVITDGTTVYINDSGNPGMAVGGSGDVLAGVITALIGQKIDPLTAGACGAWLHGAAGDLCAQKLGQYGMLPTDMLEVLPRLLK